MANDATPIPAVAHDEATLMALAAADTAIDEMREGFREEARRQVAAMRRAMAAAMAAGNAEARLLAAEEMFDASHELRGQAGTFGYGLLSMMCESLCTLIDIERALAAGTCSPVEGRDSVWDAIVHHANAVTTIVAQDLAGDGGVRGRQLAAEILRLRAYLDERAA